MALYAYGEELTAAADAEINRSYFCLECSNPVKVRRGKNRMPHFYHLRLSPSCRLYSKSEDHLLLQLEIQTLFPKNEAILERPFREIGRISDVVWEKEKIAFEIQCSNILPKEAARRIEEYQSVGHRVVWVLDDRLFNRRVLRPSEEFLRSRNGYFASFRRNGHSLFYDQFECLVENKRMKKSGRLPIDLTAPRTFPAIERPAEWPTQILRRLSERDLFFPGDLVHRALLSSASIPHLLALQNWSSLERFFEQNKTGSDFFAEAKRPWIDRLNTLLAET